MPGDQRSISLAFATSPPQNPLSLVSLDDMSFQTGRLERKLVPLKHARGWGDLSASFLLSSRKSHEHMWLIGRPAPATARSTRAKSHGHLCIVACRNLSPHSGATSNQKWNSNQSIITATRFFVIVNFGRCPTSLGATTIKKNVPQVTFWPIRLKVFLAISFFFYPCCVYIS